MKTIEELKDFFRKYLIFLVLYIIYLFLIDYAPSWVAGAFAGSTAYFIIRYIQKLENK